MHIPFIDLHTQYKEIAAEVETAIRDVLQTGHYILGEHVRSFEQEVSQYLGVPEAIGVGNGSDALLLALNAYDIGPGDEVITTPFSFIATADAIVKVGATPVFVDIDEATYNIDPAKMEERITPRTRAIVPVHLYGQCAMMEQIMETAKKHALIVIEDACQAFGAEHLGKKAGAWGHAACFSFFPTKNLGAYGDGGMLVTADQKIAEKLRMLRVHGSQSRYDHVMLGMNSRLDELQAAILRVKLRYIDRWNSRRRELASKYRSLLQGLPLRLPIQQPDNHHIYHLFTVALSEQSERAEFISYLQQHGIDTAVHYSKPIYLQPSYRQLGFQPGICAKTEQVSKQVCALPLYPEMTNEAVHQVAQAIIAFYEGRRGS